MDATLHRKFVSASDYNSLPSIGDVSYVPTTHAQELLDLQRLLEKHRVPKDFSIRLIHKHFDIKDGEVIVFQDVQIPKYGMFKVMKPVEVAQSNHLRGIHYYVDTNGSLQAYEYAHCHVPDMTAYQPFLEEFCRMVTERDLQYKFGLKLQSEERKVAQRGFVEYELSPQRCTIMFPDTMVGPDTNYSVMTEWQSPVNGHQLYQSKCIKHHYCGHGDGDDSHTDDGQLCLGGQVIIPGSEIHDVVGKVLDACESEMAKATILVGNSS